MIIFLYGADTYRTSEHLKKMTEKFSRERDPQRLNVSVVHCEDTDAGVMQALFAAPFLAEKRMVVIKQLLTTGSNELLQEVLRAIEEQRLKDDTIVIFVDNTEKPKKKLAKELFARLLKEQFVQHFEALSGVQLVGWVRAEVIDRGSRIEPAAAQLLTTNTGGDMWQLSNRIDQLTAYAQGRMITTSDVNVFSEEHIDNNIFTFVDAIIHKQQKKVFELLGEQYRQGNDAGYLYAMIIRQFRILLMLRDALDRGEQLSHPGVAKAMGLHPFVIKKSLPMVKQYSSDMLRSLHSDLLTIDIYTKTGQVNQSFMLDHFLAKHTLTS